MALFSEDDDKARAAAIAANERDQTKRREDARKIFFGELPKKIEDLYAALVASYRRGDELPVGHVKLTFLPAFAADMQDSDQREAVRRIIKRRLTVIAGTGDFVITFGGYQLPAGTARHTLDVSLSPYYTPKPN